MRSDKIKSYSTKVIRKHSKSRLGNEDQMKKNRKHPHEISGTHSANSWEEADLGSNERKEKFLRLMGASSKREHKGKIVIGEYERNARATANTEIIIQNLEEQFKGGLKHAAYERKHCGLVPYIEFIL
ncbi:unnamed protein product [Protopolystoma xenopodis]|uniref:Small acidic protein n=1 Tax=Protopolystoma xenopodis TaxID=117903 RepID=A0A3S5B6P5_9PLAT|nr:unnamed protein product [Protopolystoma xenopodis]